MTKVKLEIKDKWTGNVLFEYEKENNTLKDTVKKAVEEGADLRGANLEGADLEGAILYLWDNNEPNIDEIITNLKENCNLKVNKYYINKHVLSPYYLTYWKNALIIDEYETEESKKEVKEMTIAEISEALGYEVKIIKEEN